MNREHGSYLLLFLFCLVSLQGCASRSVMLVHPQSGATIKCGAEGTGIMAGTVDSLVGDCLNRYESQGYIEVEQLTPQQRANLENRGVLPKPEPPTFRTGY